MCPLKRLIEIPIFAEETFRYHFAPWNFPNLSIWSFFALTGQKYSSYKAARLHASIGRQRTENGSVGRLKEPDYWKIGATRTLQIGESLPIQTWVWQCHGVLGYSGTTKWNLENKRSFFEASSIRTRIMEQNKCAGGQIIRQPGREIELIALFTTSRPHIQPMWDSVLYKK